MQSLKSQKWTKNFSNREQVDVLKSNSEKSGGFEYWQAYMVRIVMVRFIRLSSGPAPKIFI